MKWISVTDRLPEKECFCLVYTPRSFPKNCKSVVAEYYMDGDFRGFYSEAFENHLDDVTHWIELTEPNETH